MEIKFTYEGLYKSFLSYKIFDIEAIFDTGAKITTIDIYSLAKLTGISGKRIYEQASCLYEQQRLGDGTTTASGGFDRTINVYLGKVCLGGAEINNFCARLNIDNVMWRTEGKLSINEKEIIIKPYILIGLDIIQHSCNSIFCNKEWISLGYFTNQKYDSVSEKYFSKKINISDF